jgi:hypothetical protein
MKKLFLCSCLLFVLTCAKEDSQAPNLPPTQIVMQYALTASAGDGGSVTGGGTFASGTQVSLTATPSSGYSFSGWSNGSTANPLTVTLNSNTSITANFQVIVNSYTLTVTAGDGGTVSTEGGEYEEGTEVTITATPEEGYEFIGWSDGDINPDKVVNIISSLSLVANFGLKYPYNSYSNNDFFTNESATELPYLHHNYDSLISSVGTPLIANNYTGPPSDAVIFDYNNDGFMDMVYSGTDYYKSFRADGTRGFIQFYYSDERGNLTLDDELSSKFSSTLHSVEGAVVDFNGDGYLDIIFADFGTHGSPEFPLPQDPSSLLAGYPIILFNLGNGDFREVRYDGPELRTPQFSSITTGDYDKDGDIDIIIVNDSAAILPDGVPPAGQIMKNNGDGTFVLETLFASQIRLNGKIAGKLFDVDKDGFLDLVLTGRDNPNSPYQSDIYPITLSLVLFGNGTNNFNNRYLDLPTVYRFHISEDIDVFDFDNDGYNDIILARTTTAAPDWDNPGYEGWYIQILKNINNQEFIDVSEEVIDDSARKIGGQHGIMDLLITDLDGDGIMDVINNSIDKGIENLPYPMNPAPILHWEIINGKFEKKTIN